MSIQCHNISLGAFCACISLSLLVLRFYFLHVTTNSKRIFELEPLLYFFFMVSSPPPPHSLVCTETSKHNDLLKPVSIVSQYKSSIL